MKVSFYALVIGSILLVVSALSAAQTVEELVDSIPDLNQESLAIELEKNRLNQENATFLAADQDLQNSYQTMLASDESFQQRAADLDDQKQTLDQEISEYNSQCEDAVFDIPATETTPAYEYCRAWEPALSERELRLTADIDRFNQELARHQDDQARFADKVMSHDAKKEELKQADAAFPERLATWWVTFDEIRRSGVLKKIEAEILAAAGCSASEMAGYIPRNPTVEMPLPTDQVRQCLDIIWTHGH